MVDDTPGFRFFGSHEAIPIQYAFYGLDRLARVLGVELVQALLGLDDILSVTLDI